MTATQIVTRFLKENGLYGEIYPYILDAFKNYCIKYENIEETKLKDLHGDKSIIIDKFLKAERLYLTIFFYRLYSQSKKMRNKYAISSISSISSIFFKYLKENVDGNYFKILIPDSHPQTSRDDYGRYRNGYHAIDFKWKKTSPFYDSCN